MGGDRSRPSRVTGLRARIPDRAAHRAGAAVAAPSPSRAGRQRDAAANRTTRRRRPGATRGSSSPRSSFTMRARSRKGGAGAICCTRLGPEIDRARRLYEERVPPTVPGRSRSLSTGTRSDTRRRGSLAARLRSATREYLSSARGAEPRAGARVRALLAAGRSPVSDAQGKLDADGARRAARRPERPLAGAVRIRPRRARLGPVRTAGRSREALRRTEDYAGAAQLACEPVPRRNAARRLRAVLPGLSHLRLQQTDEARRRFRAAARQQASRVIWPPPRRWRRRGGGSGRRSRRCAAPLLRASPPTSRRVNDDILARVGRVALAVGDRQDGRARPTCGSTTSSR